MTTPDSDTDPAAERFLVETIRRAPVWKRIALASALTEATRAPSPSPICAQFPEASDEELRRRLAFRLLTPEQVKAAYGWDPETLEARSRAEHRAAAEILTSAPVGPILGFRMSHFPTGILEDRNGDEIVVRFSRPELERVFHE